MGKPRMIILIRHAQSEGNKNREIHQTIPDHRIKLTPDGWTQAHDAGLRLRSLLRPDDTLHFFTSPYQRTRETTQGVLHSLTANEPTPSPFPRETIKVYEEPRLREQDFGNFQPCSAAMERMWAERADYGHFFYRIPNGESAADAYDRVSGFNESLWRQFGEEGFASVCVLVTHGLMARIFLMKWYHFSVECFEDLRNINHCEFVVMKQNPEDGKYLLQNKLRTWSELKAQRARELQREKSLRKTRLDEEAEAGADADTDAVDTSLVVEPLITQQQHQQPLSVRRTWGGCPEGCNHGKTARWKRTTPRRKTTKDELFEYDQEQKQKQKEGQQSTDECSHNNNNNANNAAADSAFTYGSQPEAAIQDAGDSTTDDVSSSPFLDVDFARRSAANRSLHATLAIRQLGGRDGGGSESGVASHTEESENDTDHNTTATTKHIATCQGGVHETTSGTNYQEEEEEEGKVDAGVEAAKRYDQSIRGSVY